MKKVLVAIMVSLLVVSVASAGAPWSIFGEAQSVRQDAAGEWAIELVSDASPGWAGVAYEEPDGALTFGDIYELSADFNVTDDDCAGGSPRFAIAMDTDGDGDFDGNVHVYLGPGPNFTGCAAGWQSTGNLIGLPASDLRYDLTQVGGTFYDTYDHARALVGSDDVLYVALIVDGGWALGDGEQTVLVDNVRVNNHLLAARGFAKH